MQITLGEVIVVCWLSQCWTCTLLYLLQKVQVAKNIYQLCCLHAACM